MSFANTTGHSEWSVNSGKTYITTGNFAGAFYTYTVTTDSALATIGTLTTVATAGNASSSLFGRGHHLVLNGRKLTPGANPMNAITGAATATNNPFVFGSSPGAATVVLSPSGLSANTQSGPSGSRFAPKFLVGVADIQTGLNGFIDPTNVLFALYDKNRPVSDYLVDMSAGLTAANARVTVSSGQSDRINTTSVVLANIANNNAGAGMVTDLTNVGGNIGPLGGASSGKVTMQALGSGTGTYYFSSSIVTPNTIINLTPLFDLKVTQTVNIPSVNVPALGLNSSAVNVNGNDSRGDSININSSTPVISGTAQTAAQNITIPLTVGYHITNVDTGSFRIVVDTDGANTSVTPSFYFLIIN
jgi:hypothetical protein